MSTRASEGMELLAEHQVLEDQFVMSAAGQRHRADEYNDHLQHASILSFSANQAFRDLTSKRIERIAAPTATSRTALAKGLRELTLGELRQHIGCRPPANRLDRQVALRYHLTWALPWATLALTFFALAVVSVWRGGRMGLCVIASAEYFCTTSCCSRAERMHWTAHCRCTRPRGSLMSSLWPHLRHWRRPLRG
jgi:hypothetical protein